MVQDADHGDRVSRTDTAKLPEQYRRTKITIGRTSAIKKALKAGEEIEGATLQVRRYVRVGNTRHKCGAVTPSEINRVLPSKPGQHCRTNYR
jgi:hypothetical protein